jgi:hypothetical protein
MFCRLYIAVMGLCLVCLITVSVAIERKLIPKQIAGVTTVAAEGLINLTECLLNLVIMDARMPMLQRQGYIEDSPSPSDIHSYYPPLKTTIPGRQQPILLFCNSIRSISTAWQCGYKTIYWFRGSFEDRMNRIFASSGNDL